MARALRRKDIMYWLSIIAVLAKDRGQKFEVKVREVRDVVNGANQY